MALSRRYDNALTKKRSKFVKHFHLTDTLLSVLRSECVLTEEMENEIRVNKLPFLVIIIIIIRMINVYGAVIRASHFESSPGSYDEYGTVPSGLQSSAQARVGFLPWKKYLCQDSGKNAKNH